MVNLVQYTFVSTLATIGVILHAFNTREQFFPAMMFLSSSKICVLVLANMGIVLLILFGYLLKGIFLGKLREAEIETMYEHSRQELMEICLSMTIFRNEFGVPLVFMFCVLLFVKIFHWLTQKRLEFMETTPVVSRVAQIRIVACSCLLFAADCYFFYQAASQTFTSLQSESRPTVLILFAFESVLLLFFSNFPPLLCFPLFKSKVEGRGFPA